jgi:hypothetical protein
VHVNNEGRINLRKQDTFIHDALNTLLGHYSE